MIGRTRELSVARSILVKAGPAAGPVLLRVSGEPGVGKSLFVERVAAESRDAGWFVVYTACHEIQQNTPRVAANRIVAGALRRLGADAARYVSGLEEAIAALDPSSAALLGIEPQAAAPDRDRYESVFTRLFEGIAADYSVLLVCDDAQWIDDQSASVLRALAERISIGTVALLTAERPGAHNELLPASPISIDLLPFGREEARELVRAKLPDIPEVAVDTIAQQGHGNPLDLLTICDDVRRNGTTHWNEQSTRDLVANHVLAMTASEREFLQLCALIGEPIEFRLLFKLYPQAQQIADLLEGSVRSYLISDGPHLRFRHRLIEDAIVSGMEFDFPLRTKIIAALQSIPQPEPDDFERIIAHSLACGNSDLAYDTYLDLIDAALAKRSWAAVVNASERALALQNPSSAKFTGFFAKYCKALIVTDQEAKATIVLSDALGLAEALNVTVGIGRLVAMQMAVLMTLERSEQGLVLYERYSSRLAGEERAPALSMAVGIAGLALDQDGFVKLTEEMDLLGGTDDYTTTTRLIATAFLASGMGDYAASQRALDAASVRADSKLNHQMELIEFNRTIIEFREFGCVAIHRRLTDLTAKVRFDGQDQYFTRVLFGWDAVARGDWETALSTVEAAYRPDIPVTRAAAFLAIPALIGAMTGVSTPWDADIQKVSIAAIRDDYRLSAMQLVPWAVVRGASKDLEGHLKSLTLGAPMAPPRPPDVGFIPLGMALAAARQKSPESLKVLAETPATKDLSRWALAQWTLARGIASKSLCCQDAKSLLSVAAQEFEALGASFFASYAAEEAGIASENQVSLLTKLGLKRVPVALGAAKFPERGGLTRRENEVARLVSDGLTNRQVAESLFLSERTVEVHLTNIFGKLRIASRTQLIRRMLEIV
ncbi:MAG TPA: AAA family ATPase [Candidatus Baltobacteraceae bacterium]|jgi:DNA-binding CsgD family transcriptional regulator